MLLTRNYTVFSRQAPITIMKKGLTIVNLTAVDGKHEVDFDFSDVAGGSVVIGTIAADNRIDRVALLITTTFDGTTTMTVGDASAQGRLMTAAENEPDTINRYITEPDYKYVLATELSIYFPSGTPIQGEGTIIIYYS